MRPRTAGVFPAVLQPLALNDAVRILNRILLHAVDNVVSGDSGENVFQPFLGVLDRHVEVPVVVNDTRIEQIVLELLPRRSPDQYSENWMTTLMSSGCRFKAC